LGEKTPETNIGDSEFEINMKVVKAGSKLSKSKPIMSDLSQIIAKNKPK